ncbi:MAG: PilW family protein [Pseudomonadales bacterium]
MRFNRHCTQKRKSALQQPGFTYIELLVSLMIGSLLMLGITSALSTGFGASEPVRGKNALNQQARFAMQRMQRALSTSPWLLVPFADRDSSPGWKENERDVLAVTLSHDIDRDGDGIADADNDGDGLIDEDLPEDTSNDAASGIVGIDDDGNGVVDDGVAANDDEYNVLNWPIFTNEDVVDANDDDVDGTVDDDPPADMNGDGCSGSCDVDEDGDGNTNEDDPEDDDEDGQSDEDWYDAVVFYLNGSDLIERTPVPWDEDGSGGTPDGRDFVEQTIAENVTLFAVVREPMTNERAQLVTLTLQLTDSDGQSVQLTTQVRVGGAI